jgi:hypothetical protein
LTLDRSIQIESPSKTQSRFRFGVYRYRNNIARPSQRAG